MDKWGLGKIFIMLTEKKKQTTKENILYFKMLVLGGTWVTKSVEYRTLSFGSGHETELWSWLHTRHGVCVVSLSLWAPPPDSLSKINI